MAEANDLLQPPITAIPSSSPPPPPPPPTTTSATTTAPPPSSETHPAGPSLAPKRQRRPSVRLGEIGDQPAATLSSSHDSQHSRRPKYKFSKTYATAAAAAVVKARSLTNLVNGNSNSNAVDYSHETLIPDQNGGDRRPVKTKRPTKRARSSWVSSSKAAAEGDSDDEGFRGIDDDHPGESESPMKENSLIQSLDNGAALGLWNGGGGGGGGGDGVRTWLIELGLSRYAPVFEIHEVDDEVLPLLTLEDLKDMGINAVGSRRKLYTAIQKLRKRFSHEMYKQLKISLSRFQRLSSFGFDCQISLSLATPTRC